MIPFRAHFPTFDLVRALPNFVLRSSLSPLATILLRAKLMALFFNHPVPASTTSSIRPPSLSSLPPPAVVAVGIPSATFSASVLVVCSSLPLRAAANCSSASIEASLLAASLAAFSASSSFCFLASKSSFRRLKISETLVRSRSIPIFLPRAGTSVSLPS